MNYDFDVLPACRDSVKWNAYPPDVIPLWIAEMDFPSPQPVVEALVERARQGIYGYPPVIARSPETMPELRQAIVEHLARRHGWQVSPADLVFIPGVITGFNLACLALAQPHEAVLIQPPVYPPIVNAADETGIRRQDAPLVRRPDGSYEVDWEAFEAAITPQTRLFILCNPHNPVGKVYTQQELERLAHICLSRGVTIVADEIHCDLVYSGYRHIPIASLDEEIARHTITLMAPSKTYNLPGLQCSFAIIPNPELRQRFLQATRGLVPWVNLFGLVAAQAAYEQGQEWLSQVLTYLEGNREALLAYAHERLPGVHIGRPAGTYLAWLDCRAAQLPEAPHRFFLERARVALTDGVLFGKGGEGFVRLNFACPRFLLIQALERMSQALQDHLSRSAL